LDEQISPSPTKQRAAAAATPLLALLIAQSAVGPLTLNILMPAVPALVTSFKTDAATAQLTLSLFLLGLAVSQLVLGSLSDRFGRRPVMLAGLVLTVIASFAALFAETIGWLIVARTVQALGASTGLVVGRAVIRDLYERDRAASMIAWVTMAMVVAPMIAPLIGGLLDTMFGWHAIFLFVGLFSTIVLVWTAIALPETRAVTAGGGGLRRFLEEAAALARNRRFIGYVLCSALGSGMFFAFIAGAPHITVTIMGKSSAEYGLWFVLLSAGYMVGNFVAGRWSSRHGIDTMVWWGVVLGSGFAILQVATVLMFPDSIVAVFLPQIIMGFANGFLLPNAIAGAVSVRPQASGTASGVTGFLQMGLGAAVAQLVGHLITHASTALPMVLVALACGMGSLIVLSLCIRR
jgi:DHA1 family bicyclomycin/chloramphenicol resistance-like MFS transporter